MSLSKYTTAKGWFFVEIIKPSQKELDNYYSNSGEMKSSSSKAPLVFKKAIIKHTHDGIDYPTNSTWIMGESPGLKINFFGEKLIAIQEKDLYARIN